MYLPEKFKSQYISVDSDEKKYKIKNYLKRCVKGKSVFFINSSIQKND